MRRQKGWRIRKVVVVSFGIVCKLVKTRGGHPQRMQKTKEQM
jgi:hypothetical protein